MDFWPHIRPKYNFLKLSYQILCVFLTVSAATQQHPGFAGVFVGVSVQTLSLCATCGLNPHTHTYIILYNLSISGIFAAPASSVVGYGKIVKFRQQRAPQKI